MAQALSLIYLAADADPRYMLVTPESVAAHVADGAIQAFEYGTSSVVQEAATLALVPRSQIERWGSDVGMTLSDMVGLTDAQLIMAYLRKLGRTAISHVSVTELDEVTGDAAGGEPVEITGTGFSVGRAASTVVTFGEDAATSVVVVSDTTITCVTPAHAAGAVAVTVTNSNGSHTLADAFTYA